MLQHEADSSLSAADDSADGSSYRSISALALVGFALALASPLAFVHPALAVSMAIPAVVCLAALSRIGRSDGQLAGRRLALVGLSLPILCGVASVTHLVTKRHLLEAEARDVAERYFAHLAKNELLEAQQLTERPSFRIPQDRLDWEYYGRDETKTMILRMLLEDLATKSLLRLGAKAEVRYLQTETWTKASDGEALTLVYAVTYPYPDSPQGKRTFFVKVECARTADGWRVMAARGPYRPKGMVLPPPAALY